jgi:hypothetical protein
VGDSLCVFWRGLFDMLSEGCLCSVDRYLSEGAVDTQALCTLLRWMDGYI